MWATMASWFTPAVLFCVLNLMIGTIFFTSNFKSRRNKTQPDDDNEHHNNYPTQLIRAPSLLERVRSINFSPYRSELPEPAPLQQTDTHIHTQTQTETQTQTQTPLVRASSLLDRLRSFNFRSEQPDSTQDAGPAHDHEDQDHRAVMTLRSKSEHVIGEGRRPASVVRMRKVASEKALAEEEEAAAEELNARRPATTREGNRTATFGEDEEVDAKADDFINRFKNQLKLQRLDSLLRYKEMLTRGSGR